MQKILETLQSIDGISYECVLMYLNYTKHNEINIHFSVGLETRNLQNKI